MSTDGTPPPTSGSSSYTPPPDGPIVTVDRAAEILCCARTKVFQLIAQGKLERAPRYGKKAVVTLESVLALTVVEKKAQKRRKARAEKPVPFKAEDIPL